MILVFPQLSVSGVAQGLFMEAKFPGLCHAFMVIVTTTCGAEKGSCTMKLSCTCSVKLPFHLTFIFQFVKKIHHGNLCCEIFTTIPLLFSSL